jgi:hypothetical protein
MNSRLSILFAAACLALASGALAAGPQLINYQGTLTNDQGQPLDGTYSLTFKVYAAASGGTALWTQTSASVAVADGLFSVLLGSTAFPAGLFTGADRWLGVTVGAAAELTPRARFTSVPWALRATVADTALAVAGGGGSDGDWTISGSNMYSAVSGNVGIGATSPARKLQIGQSSTLNSEGMIRLVSRSGTQGSYRIWDIGVPETDSDTSGPGYSFIIDDTSLGDIPEVMVKYGSGNVGIGTVVPAKKLHVDQGNDYTDGIRLSSGSQYPSLYADFTVAAGGGGLVVNSNAGGGSWADISLQTNGTTKVYIDQSGNMGVGTTSPQSKFHVAGVARVDVLHISGADLAEKFPLSEQGEPGTVVVIDPDRAGMLRPSGADYDTRVAGVISGAGGLSVGAVLGQCTPEEDAQPIAMSGRVWTRCDASAYAIEPGDLLTTSGRPGHAMKAVDPARSHGAVIGKAMTRLARGETGLVLVLINLQ